MPTTTSSWMNGIREHSRTWLITGVAGFIGSHLLESLLHLGQTVVGLDNFSTGAKRNLNDVRQSVGEGAWARFRMIEGDIGSPGMSRAACRGVDYVLHQAALGSVPRSIENPQASFESNVMGFLQLLLGARDEAVQRVVYASSSSVYGDSPDPSKCEEKLGKPLSPYAATKLFDEVIADVFSRCYGIRTIGLRYFNVFGPRQDPDGPYAAVIPRWINALMQGETVFINGDGETSRDFTYVENVVQANLRAATVTAPEALNQVYNVAMDSTTTLNQLLASIQRPLATRYPDLKKSLPIYREFRAGDVRHSQADLSKGRRLLGYEPTHSVEQGLKLTIDWYFKQSVRGNAAKPSPL